MDYQVSALSSWPSLLDLGNILIRLILRSLIGKFNLQVIPSPIEQGLARSVELLIQVGVEAHTSSHESNESLGPRNPGGTELNWIPSLY